MRPLLLTALLALVAGLAVRSAAAQSRQSDHGTIVIVTGELATRPVPTLMDGAAATSGNSDVANQLFLRLAGVGPTLATAGDRSFVPLLARSWSRRDSLTLVFDLDPRARWHDGAPVRAEDVVFTMARARDETITPTLANLLRHISSVTAEGEQRVVFRFDHVYGEQFYDATFHVAPLPAHLLARLTPAAFNSAAFVAHPVGNGPYRWGRSVEGQFQELVANDSFFLGRPKLDRVIFRLATDADARINLLLSGEADALENVAPLSNVTRLKADTMLRLIPVPSRTVGYLLFNTRDPADHSRPHPILGDLAVRRAIIAALDRPTLARSVFGPYAAVPFGPVSAVLWIGAGSPAPVRQNVAQARTLLAGAGWRDTDGAGTLARAGAPLRLQLSLPNTSASRRMIALQVQEQLRQVGVQLDLVVLERAAWVERRSAGNFDIDFSQADLDPSPSGLTQSWSCEGGSNVAHYCDAGVDSLFERAILSPTKGAHLWHQALERLEGDAPAVFLYTPAKLYAIHRRFRHIDIRPESSWMLLRDWSVAPSERLPRDDAPGR